MCLYTLDGKTEYEEAFVNALDQTCNQIKKLLLADEMRLALNRPDMDESDLKKLNPIWYKKDGLKIIKDKATLYAKLICSRELTVFTEITDEYDNKIDARTLLNQRFTGSFAIKVESIYFGNKISLQVKAVEIVVHANDRQERKLLPRKQAPASLFPPVPPPVVPDTLLVTEDTLPVPEEPSPVVQEDIQVSESEDDEEEEPEQPPPPVARGKPPVRRGRKLV
jgi:hypothetical protein